MREARIKIDPNIGEAIYHCISRAVAAERMFGEVAREIFRGQLWAAAEFSGLEVITYAILSNHLHVVVRVPRKASVSDEELLRRYQLLYPKPKKHARDKLSTIKAWLVENGPPAEKWRQQQLARMGDVSAFMKTWKQRFSIWFNKANHRIGTLWASRFTSILMEPTGFASEAVAAYVDLNAVRAGIVRDPKDYRFCGYAEAVAGRQKAREGLMSLYRTLSWNETQAHYRQTMFGIGCNARSGKASISRTDFLRVIREKGELPLSDLILCRVRHFVHGGILGSKRFVQEQLARYEESTRPRPRTRPRPLPVRCDQEGLFILRNVRQQKAA